MPWTLADPGLPPASGKLQHVYDPPWLPRRGTLERRLADRAFLLELAGDDPRKIQILLAEVRELVG